MRFLVIGVGSIGKRHIKNLLSLGQEVYAFDGNIDKVNEVTKIGASRHTYTNNYDAYIICTPPDSHIEHSFTAWEHKSHIFIEKPISNNLNRVGELISKAKTEERIIQVGYQLRFHPGLRLVKKLIDEDRIGKLLSIQAEFGQYLPDWHPGEDYRNLYTAHEDQGGGIILDASHEIDYTRWLADSEIRSVACFTSHRNELLDMSTDDSASILLKCANNLVITICLDFNNRTYTRNCELIGEKGTIIWDYNLATVMLFDGTEHNLMSDRKTDMYLEEMKSLISCIERKDKPVVDGETGKRVLEIALAAKQSATENKVVEV